MFSCNAAVAAGALNSKDKIFCLRPDPNPAVVAFECQPAKLGLPPSMLPTMPTTTEPYRIETLNLIPGSSDAGFTGTWRHLSCACNVCLFAVDGMCTSYGAGVQAPPWIPYKITRRPPAATKSMRNRTNSFLVQFVEFSIASCLQREVAIDFTAEIAGFMVHGMKLYKTLRGGSGLVRERFALTNWLRLWVMDEHKRCASPAAWALARTDIAARVARSGWQPPAPQPRSQAALQAPRDLEQRILEFIDSLIK